MKSLRSSIIETGISLYMIGGYLMLFSGITTLLLTLLPISSLYFQSLLEFSNGITVIHQAELSIEVKLIFSCFLLGFAGLCVHMQIMSMIEHVKLSYLKFLLYRIIQGMLSAGFFYLCLYFF